MTWVSIFTDPKTANVNEFIPHDFSTIIIETREEGQAEDHTGKQIWLYNLYEHNFKFLHILKKFGVLPKL